MIDGNAAAGPVRIGRGWDVNMSLRISALTIPFAIVISFVAIKDHASGPADYKI